jgi:hypothetical protein
MPRVGGEGNVLSGNGGFFGDDNSVLGIMVTILNAISVCFKVANFELHDTHFIIHAHLLIK